MCITDRSRVIQEYIKKPLADELLFGKLVKGGLVRISVARDDAGDNKLAFEYFEPKLKRPAKTKPKGKSSPSGGSKPRVPLLTN